MDTQAHSLSHDRVLAEIQRIASAPDFARAPVMRRLLDFLVNETLDGRGDQLKAYAVAVDGLGRPDDFDAQQDSYPRVQVGRLRRMLDAFYAREGVADGIRLSIPPGRYRVEITPPADDEPTGTVPRARQPSRRIALGLALLLLAAFAGLGLSWLATDKGRRGPVFSEAPVLQLDHIAAPPELEAIEIEADAVLLDGLRRSPLVRIRSEGAQVSAVPAEIYRLSGDIDGVASPVLRLKLERQGNRELVWTGNVPLPPDRASLAAALAPLIAELVQPYGVIAANQRSRIVAPPLPGYHCIRRYDDYRRNRSKTAFAGAQACIGETIRLRPGNGEAQAIQANLIADGQLYKYAPPSPDALVRAFRLGRSAIAADPYSPTAHIIFARLAVANDRCGVAGRSARRAVALNPHDPDLLSMAGLYLLDCDDPGARAMLERSLALDPDPPATFIRPFVYMAIGEGRFGEARRYLDQMGPSLGTVPGFQEMLETVVLAGAGDIPAARAAWARIKRKAPGVASDPAAFLAGWKLPPAMRVRSLEILQRAGLWRPPGESG